MSHRLDGARLGAVLLALPLALEPIAAVSVLQVGPGRGWPMPCQASAAARDGDTIEGDTIEGDPIEIDAGALRCLPARTLLARQA